MRKHLHNQAEHSHPTQQQPSNPTGQITTKSRPQWEVGCVVFLGLGEFFFL